MNDNLLDVPDFLRRPEMIALDNLPKPHNGCNCICHKIPNTSHCIPCCGNGVEKIINLSEISQSTVTKSLLQIKDAARIKKTRVEI